MFIQPKKKKKQSLILSIFSLILLMENGKMNILGDVEFWNPTA